MLFPRDAKSPKENEEYVEVRELRWVPSFSANSGPISQAWTGKNVRHCVLSSVRHQHWRCLP